MVHHGNEEVQEYDDVDHGVRSEHQHAPEARERLDPLELEILQVDQTKSRPEKRLYCLEQAGKISKNLNHFK